MRWSGGPAESFTWTIGKRPGQRAKYASGSCPPLVIQYRSTSSWTSLGSVSASSTIPNWSSWRWTCTGDRKSTRLNSSHGYISYAVFCLKKKNQNGYPHDVRSHRRGVRSPSTSYQARSPVVQRCLASRLEGPRSESRHVTARNDARRTDP